MIASPPPVTSPGWSSRTKRIVLLICLLVVGLTAIRLTEILPIIVISMVLSYLLNPLATFIDRRILSRGGEPSHRSLAIVLTFLVFIGALVLVVFLVLPVLIDQVQEFATRLPALVETVQGELERILSQPISIGGQTFVPLASIQRASGTPAEGSMNPLENVDIGSAATTFVRSLTGPAFGFVGGAFSALINLVFLLTMMFYLLKDGARFADAAVNITPLAYKGDTRRLLHELSLVWDGYLRGQFILSGAMGLLVFVTALILGVPNAPILGLLSGLLEFIPNLGPLLALIPAVLLALSSQSSTFPFLEGGTFAIVVVVVWTLLQNVEAVVLVPRVMGSSLNLHPFVVIIGVLAGAALAGALGVILAAPIIASLRVLGQYVYGKLTDQNPFPTPHPSELRSAHRGSLGHRLQLAVRYLRRQFAGR